MKTEIKKDILQDKRRMKVAIFDMDNLKNPHWAGGQARVTYETGKRLSKEFDIEVYCSKYPDWKNYTSDNISYHHIGIGTHNAKLNNFIYILAIPLIAFRLKADVIIEDFSAPFSICFTPLYTQIPVIGRGSFFATEKLSKKYKIPFNSVLKLGIRMYKYFIALNLTQVQDIKKMNHKIDSQLIYNGVDSENFRYPTVDGRYILFMGRIDIFHKGLDLLLEAYAKAISVIDEPLYIMGTGSKEEIDRLKSLIKVHKLESKVKLLGKKSGAEKNNIIANSKFMVFSSRYEGHSLASLESLSFGKPFVYFGVTGFEWVNEAVGLKVPSFDIEKYKKGIIELSKNTNLRSSMSKEAREFAKGYDWDAVAEKYQYYLYKVVRKEI